MSPASKQAFHQRRLNDANSIEAHALILAVEGSPGTPRWTLAQTSEEIALGNTFGLFLHERMRAVLFMQHQAEVCEITYLVTHPDCRRQGIMETLLYAIIKEIRERTSGLNEIWLEVHELNAPAQSMYRKLGFVATGRRPRYYRDGAAAVLMVLRLIR